MSEGKDISCVEDSVHDNGFNWWSGFHRWGELDVLSVNDMVTKVLAKAGSSQIRTLEIVGHGSPGNQSVGDGQTFDSTGAKCLYIDMDSGKLIGKAEEELVRLKGKFTQNAVVTLGGCSVGDGERGQALMKRISKLLNDVTVEASDSTQYATPGMEGNVLRCKGESCWVHRNAPGTKSKKKK